MYQPLIKTTLTRQTAEILAALEDSKNYCESRMLICETGAGKTYTVQTFAAKNPYSFVVTVSGLHRKSDIINDLYEVTGIRGQYKRITNINISPLIDRLRQLQAEGKQPQIIIDEAENLKVPSLALFKGLYDALKRICPIVLIGTEQLQDSLVRLSRKNEQGVPQFVRRFKAGTRNISSISRADLLKFIEPYVNDKQFQNLLLNLATNYGEMSDFLEPVLRHAKDKGKQVTEDLFRKYHKIL